MFDACSRCEITARIWFVEASSHASYTKHTPRTSLGTHGARPFARACKSRAHQRMRTSAPAPGHAKMLAHAYCNANSAMKLCCTDLHACVGCSLRNLGSVHIGGTFRQGLLGLLLRLLLLLLGDRVFVTLLSNNPGFGVACGKTRRQTLLVNCLNPGNNAASMFWSLT